VIRPLYKLGILPGRTNDPGGLHAAAIRGWGELRIWRELRISTSVLWPVALVTSTRSSGARHSALTLAFAKYAQQMAEDLDMPDHPTC
jgi:hypothetical protein